LNDQVDVNAVSTAIEHKYPVSKKYIVDVFEKDSAQLFTFIIIVL